MASRQRLLGRVAVAVYALLVTICATMSGSLNVAPPASATAQAACCLSLTVSPTVVYVGDAVTFEAAVFVPNIGSAPGAHVRHASLSVAADGVTFYVTHGSVQPIPGVLQGDGVWRATYRPKANGLFMVTASHPTYGTSNAESFRALGIPTADVSTSSASSVVGNTLSITVDVTKDPKDGQVGVSIQVVGANPHRSLPLVGTFPHFTARYVGLNVGTDDIITTLTFGGAANRTKPVHTAHTWVAPSVQWEHGPTTTDLGEVAVVSARVTDPPGARVQLDVTSGPNKGQRAPASGSIATLRYRGLTPGTDHIQATVILDKDAGKFASGAIDHSWRTPLITLDPGPGSSVVGTQSTVTAIVTGTKIGKLTATVSGANVGAIPKIAGGVPTFRISYVGRQAGQDLLRAALTIPGSAAGPYSATPNPLRHSWIQPRLVVEQATGASKVGTQLRLTATVDPPLPGAVTFHVRGGGENLDLVDSSPGSDHTASYSRTQQGTDSISASFRPTSGPTLESNTVIHTWTAVEPPTVTVSPAGTTSCVDTAFSSSVSVRVSGQPQAGAAIRMTATGAGVPTQVKVGSSGSDGLAVLPYTRAVPTVDTVIAQAMVDGSAVTSQPVSHRWVRCGLAVHVGPPGTTSSVKTAFTPTVRVLDGEGHPVRQAHVKVVVTRVGLPELVREAATDQNGLTTVSYVRTVAGQDTISATATRPGLRGVAAISHDWADNAGLAIELAPAGTTSSLGQGFTATALVTDKGLPVPNAHVALTATLPGTPPPLTRNITTDADGIASVTFTRRVPGIDELVARTTIGSRAAEAAIEHLWVKANTVALSISPAGRSSLLGTLFTARAHVTVNGRPAAHQQVNVVASRTGQPDVTRVLTTDRLGRANFSYARAVAGLDTIVAFVTMHEGTAQDSMAHLWLGTGVIPTPKPPTMTVSGGSVSGAPLRVSGTGCPAASSVRVTVDGSGAGQTTADGTGTFTLTVPGSSRAIGQHKAVATCVSVVMQDTFSVTRGGESPGTTGAQAASTMAVFTFMILLGAQLIRVKTGYVSA